MSYKLEPGEQVYLTVECRACDGALQVSIGIENENGGGHGYRIAGPKYDGSGKNLIRHALTPRDKKEIESYLAAAPTLSGEHSNE